VSSPLKQSGRPAGLDGAEVVEGADERCVASAEGTEPVVVGVVTVDDAHALPSHPPTEPEHIPKNCVRAKTGLEREIGQEGNPGLPGFTLEAVPPDHPQENAVALQLEPFAEADHRV